MVQRYWHLEAISGFERRAVETTLAALLSHPEHGACWVADNGGLLCGYLTAVYMLSVEHGGWMAEIDEFFVRDELRSQGLGTQLIAMAEQAMTTAAYCACSFSSSATMIWGGRSMSGEVIDAVRTLN